MEKQTIALSNLSIYLNVYLINKMLYDKKNRLRAAYILVSNADYNSGIHVVHAQHITYAVFDEMY